MDTLQPCNDWLLVRTDPLPDKVGSLYLPEKGTIYTAEVLAAGPGKLDSKGHRLPLDVRIGERIAFLRWNLEHQQGKQLAALLKDLDENLGLIKEQDVLFVIPPGEEGTIS